MGSGIMIWLEKISVFLHYRLFSILFAYFIICLLSLEYSLMYICFTSFFNCRPMKLSLTIKSELLICFFPLLRQGVILRGNMGCGIEAFISEQLELPADYVKNRIQTVFLNGKAVDDVSSTMVRPDSTLTLSAAMPGLAGAP